MYNLSYETLLDSLFDGVYYVDLDRRITFWNKGAERITGYTRAEVMGSCCYNNLLRHIDVNGQDLCTNGCPLSATLQDGKPRQSDLFLHHKLGHRVPISSRISPVRGDDGKVVGGIEIFTDNSSFLQILHELEHLRKEAYRDALTGVGNRKYGEMSLDTRLFEYQNHKIPFVVMFLDIDHFKRVNDTYGHKVGDDVLVMVAKSISCGLRNVDIVARWGGEEFILLLPGLTINAVGTLAERIRTLVQSSFIMIDNKRLIVTASIGATQAMESDSAETVISRADTLMYQSKSAGRNRVTTDIHKG